MGERAGAAWCGTGALSVALVVLSLAGCARAHHNRTGPARSSCLITAAEIEEAQRSDVRDLYQLIERLRPLWLRGRGERGVGMSAAVLVYHNNARLGDVNVLRDYSLSSIASVRYLDSAQAGILPRAGLLVEGAILISTTPENLRDHPAAVRFECVSI